MWSFFRRIYSYDCCWSVSLKECSQSDRGNAMQAVPVGKGAMAAFMGADITDDIGYFKTSSKFWSL